MRMKDFRPISCCNFCYKVISKIIANRIKSFLSFLVDENKSAFVKGRSIQDNILLMHDLVKSYQKTGGPSSCALKADIMKAFDTVKWDYLMSILSHMNIPEDVRKWIHLCISSPSFSININGSFTGNFRASRGLRQDDPLSPTLFIIVMERFTQTLKSQIQQGPFTHHPKCNSLNLCSLAFADDLFILSSTDKDSIRTIKRSIDIFMDMSGLAPNLSKSEIFVTGTSPFRKNGSLTP